MADFDDFNADLNDDSARNRRMFLLLIGGLTTVAAVAFFACGGLVWFVATRFDEIPLFGEFAAAEMPPVVHETLDEKRAWAQSAFTEPPPFAVERRPIETLFRQVSEACQADDDTAFQQLVDARAYWTRVKESGLLQSLTRADDIWYENQILGTLEVPATYTALTVQAVTRGRRSNEAVAYVIADEEGWITEMRWWLVQRGNSWRVCDWESLQSGHPYSRRHAAYVAEIANIDGHETALNALAVSDRKLNANRRLDAVAEIRKAEAARVPEMFRAEHRLEVAFGWARAGLEIHEFQTYRAATEDELDQAPGLLLGWAMSESVAGRHERALELIDRFAQAVGGGPNVERVRGDSLFALGRFDEAAESYVRLLNRTPTDSALRSEMARLLPAGRIGAVLNSLRRAADPATEAFVLAAAVSDRPEFLGALERFLAEIQPDSGELLLVRGDRLAAEKSFDDAANAYRAAYDKLPATAEVDETTGLASRAVQTDAVSRIVEMFCANDRAPDAYELAPDRKQAFEEIVYYSDEYGFSAEGLEQVVASHLRDFPNDPVALGLAASTATENGDAGQALDFIQRAAAHNKEGDYGFLFVSGFLAAEQPEKAEAWVREHPQDVAAFDALAEHLVAEEEWESLIGICNAVAADREDALPIVTTRKATALTRFNRFGEAERLLADSYRTLNEDWQRSQLLSQWYVLSADAGRPPERIIDQIGVEAFGSLITTAELAFDFETAEALEKAWQERGGDAEDRLPYTIRRLWRNKDYNAIARAMRGLEVDSLLADDRGSEAAEPFIRSLLRLKRFDEARRAAFRVYEATTDATLLSVTCLASADWERADDALAALAEYRRSSLYSDPDAGPALDRADATDLRRQLPRKPYDFVDSSRVTVLFRQAPGRDVEAFADRLRQILADGDAPQVESLDDTVGGEETLYRVRFEDDNWLVNVGDDPYTVTSSAAETMNASLHMALEDHTGWIAVDRPAGNRSERSATHLAGRIAGAFTEFEPLAVHNFDDTGSTLLPWSDDLPERMRRDDFHPQSERDAESYWLVQTAEEEGTTVDEELPLRDLAAAFAGRAPQDVFLVEATLPFTHGGVEVRLRVDRVVASLYMVDVIGAIESGLPESLADVYGIRPDDRLALNGWNIRRWFREKDDAPVDAAENTGPQPGVPVEAPRP